MEINYNNPFKISDIEILKEVNNEEFNLIDFKLENRYFSMKYNKFKTFGFKFITEYTNKFTLLNKNTTADPNCKTIYGPNKYQCTEEGKFIEYCLSKINFNK